MATLYKKSYAHLKLVSIEEIKRLSQMVRIIEIASLVNVRFEHLS
jgi:hypothetical protein